MAAPGRVAQQFTSLPIPDDVVEARLLFHYFSAREVVAYAGICTAHREWLCTHAMVARLFKQHFPPRFQVEYPKQREGEIDADYDKRCWTAFADLARNTRYSRIFGVCVSRMLIERTGLLRQLTPLKSGGVAFIGVPNNVIQVVKWRPEICTQRLKGGTDKINHLVCSDNGQLVSISEDKTLRVWNPTSGECEHLYSQVSGDIDTAIRPAILRNGNIAFASREDNTKILIWAPDTRELRILAGHTQQVHCLISLDRGLVSGSKDGTIRIWNTDLGGECIRTLEGHMGPIFGLIHLGGARFISCSLDKTIKVWNLDVGKCVQTFESSRPIGSLAWLGNEQVACMGLYDYSIGILDLDLGVYTKTPQAHLGTGLYGGLVCPEEGQLISSSIKGLILWDFMPSKPQQALGEIAGLLEKKPAYLHREAIERFNAMPKAVREGVYGALSRILRPKAEEDRGYGASAFHDQNGIVCCPSVKAEAIQRYLRESC